MATRGTSTSAHVGDHGFDQTFFRRQPRSQTCQTRPRREPLQPQVCRRHPCHPRLTQTREYHARRPHHDHHARRPHHSHNDTRLATAPHENKNRLQHDIKKPENVVAVQGMNIEVLPPEGEIKYLGQLTAFKDAVQVEFDHHIKCAWPTLARRRQELTSPTYPLRDRLKLFDATVTPSLLCASGTWTMTEEMKKKLQTTQRRMMRMIMLTTRKSGKRLAAAHAAYVDEIADGELHDPDSEPENDTTDANPQDLNEQEQSSHDSLDPFEMWYSSQCCRLCKSKKKLQQQLLLRRRAKRRT